MNDISVHYRDYTTRRRCERGANVLCVYVLSRELLCSTYSTYASELYSREYFMLSMYQCVYSIFILQFAFNVELKSFNKSH